MKNKNIVFCINTIHVKLFYDNGILNLNTLILPFFNFDFHNFSL